MLWANTATILLLRVSCIYPCERKFMNKIGRPPLSAEEKSLRHLASRKKAQVKKKQLELERKQNGLCRICGFKVCETSKTYCAEHIAKIRKRKGKKRTKFECLKMNAKGRGIPVSFDEDSFNEWLSFQNHSCEYCGVEFTQLPVFKRRNNCGFTIDRKDSTSGYQPGNVCLACFRCNAMKSNFFTYDEWKKIANEFIKPRLQEFHKTRCSYR